ncbi:MAG: tRNA pseudouridine(38-40) synthase TruA [Candidatus Pedobacter colombiensis]|uniref:tRNA pseudouridine synthase A n=1 Tax=Candidatus Pedobacter colombiensis TaxID=3121371 RepID=A0AAJ5WBZ6_9SPHI|nr:tRNA pseudouridine(38-40) synthase TruA [Pedobacter sp.]WEK19917.1 MAG: tRNA pseudouridine(38-40) synthase TruA [Pedobacter sp.]
MQRYFIELSYDGTAYHGWQIQPNAITVQECLDKALSVYFRQLVSTLGCGRTDSGVHATQFYAHFDLQIADADNSDERSTAKVPDPLKSVTGINSLLPYQIAVKRVFRVDDTAHARFDATERAYHYQIHFHKDPFKLNRSWLYKGELDMEAMNKAAQLLLGYTDFSCFSKSNTQTFTNNCKITTAFFEEKEEGLQFTIRADRFLRNMVRAIVGTLIRIGKKELNLDEFKQIVESKNRSNAGQSVPACGLYLVNVIYPFVK